MRGARILGAVIITAVLAGCAGIQKKPDWATKSAGAFKGDKKALYGVGIADGIKSEPLRRSAADNRAIAEISKQLSVMSTSMMMDYLSSANATEEERSSGEQYVESTVKTFASNTISGIRITDRWDDGKTAYSLASLDINDLKAMAGQIEKLSESVKEHIKANAEKAFDRLNTEQGMRGK